MISLPTQILEMTGADAAKFAHAQFCNDVLGLASGRWQWNAWLSPQGRVRTFFHLLRIDADHVLLLLRGGDAEWLHAELARYVFRTQVQLRAVNNARLAITEDAAEIKAMTGALPGAFALVGHAGCTAMAIAGDPPRWLLLDRDKTPTGDVTAPERWRLSDIRVGLPEIGAELRDTLLPQWIRLDRLGAVSVDKGCYPGQEIMARLHFKGGNKRSLYRLRWPGNAIAVPGTPLRGPDGAEAGTLVTSAFDPTHGHIEALASLVNSAADVALKLESLPACAIAVVQHFG